MNKIIEAAEKRDEIMASQEIFCPICSKRQYSPFDKLYVFAYGKCNFCTDDDDELLALGENILAIIGEWDDTN